MRNDFGNEGTINPIIARADLLHYLRSFMAARGVCEVETPLLASYGVTDPDICIFEVRTETGRRYLQSSPEFAMKRLLAAGSGDIYQITKAFRSGELGEYHNPEFTLVEWYRIGFSHLELLREVAELVCSWLDIDSWQVWTYDHLVADFLGFDLFEAGIEVLETYASEKNLNPPNNLDRRGWVDFLFSYLIESRLSMMGMVFITDFPVELAALSRLEKVAGKTVACRFECYVNGLELANGYWEETDASELAERFSMDNDRLISRGQSSRELDPRFLAAHVTGLPNCAGVAMGVDRLLMTKLQRRSLAEVLSFSWADI